MTEAERGAPARARRRAAARRRPARRTCSRRTCWPPSRPATPRSCGCCARRPRRRCARARPDLARDYLRRALREPPAADELAGVLSELGEAEWCCGRGPRRRRRSTSREALARTEDPALRPARALALHQAVFVSGRLVEAYELLEREIEPRDRRSRTPRTCGGWRPRWRRSGCSARRPSAARTRAWRASRRSPATRPASCCRSRTSRAGSGRRAPRRRPSSTAAARSRGARAQAADALDSIPIYEALWVLCYADAHELALVGARRHARRRARPRLGVRHLDLVRAARPDRAAARRRDHRRAGGAHRGRARRACRASCARRCSARSRWRSSRAATSTAPRPRSRESGCGPSLPEFVCLNPVFYARGVLRAAQGRHEEALADFTEFGERSARIAPAQPGRPVAARRRRVPAAPRLPGRGGRARRRAARARAALGHAVGDRHRAARAGARARRRAGRAREAADVLAGSPARLDHARCLVDLGAALRRANQRAAAREPLREGLELARRCGADALVRRAHDELVVAGGRPRRLMFSGPDALTPSERRVAELAADGHEQPRDRAAAVRDDQDGRQPPRAGLRQARDLLARAARGRRCRTSPKISRKATRAPARLREQSTHSSPGGSPCTPSSVPPPPWSSPSSRSSRSLGGTSYAAASLAKNSVGTSQIRKGAVKTADLGATP